MSKTAQEFLKELSALEIRRRLDDITREEKALRVLLRASRQLGQPTAVDAAESQDQGEGNQ